MNKVMNQQRTIENLCGNNHLSTKGEQGIVKDNFMILKMIIKKIITFFKRGEIKPGRGTTRYVMVILS